MPLAGSSSSSFGAPSSSSHDYDDSGGMKDDRGEREKREEMVAATEAMGGENCTRRNEDGLKKKAKLRLDLQQPHPFRQNQRRQREGRTSDGGGGSGQVPPNTPCNSLSVATGRLHITSQQLQQSSRAMQPGNQRLTSLFGPNEHHQHTDSKCAASKDELDDEIPASSPLANTAMSEVQLSSSDVRHDENDDDDENVAPPNSPSTSFSTSASQSSHQTFTNASSSSPSVEYHSHLNHHDQSDGVVEIDRQSKLREIELQLRFHPSPQSTLQPQQQGATDDEDQDTTAPAV